MAWFMGFEQLHAHHAHRSKTDALIQQHAGAVRREVKQAVTSVGRHVLPEGLQIPVVNPTQYFTDKLNRDPPPQPSWWSDLQQTALQSPTHLVEAMFRGAMEGLRYVGWNYVDFLDQWKSWDGSWTGLLTHASLMWRTVVTVLLTAGLIQIGPLLLAVTEWVRMLGAVLVRTFGFVGDAVTLVWNTLEELMGYLYWTVQRLLSGHP